MPKKKSSRAASGSGSIRQRPDGRWEARYTEGTHAGTGKPVRRSLYADSQKDVAEKLRKVLNDLDTGAYVEPSKLTVSAWLDIWTSDYLGGVKESTKENYKGYIKNRIKPALGAVALQKLKPHQIQAFYNTMQLDGVKAKTVRNIHGILHAALKQANKIGYLKANPSDMCEMPRVTKSEIPVMDNDTVAAFLTAIDGHRFEAVFFVDLFTGMRQGEILGLAWGCVDFEAGTILVSRQLSKGSKDTDRYFLDTLKNDKPRKIKPAAIVMHKLREQKNRQTEWRLKAGPAWTNPLNLVFTDEIGGHMVHGTVYRHYKQIVASIGKPDLRFHDMRHSFAVISLMSGDDIKTVQGNLGHHTAAFTLDTYAHVTEQMQDESAKRMDNFIQNLTEKKA